MTHEEQQRLRLHRAIMSMPFGADLMRRHEIQPDALSLERLAEYLERLAARLHDHNLQDLQRERELSRYSGWIRVFGEAVAHVREESQR